MASSNISRARRACLTLANVPVIKKDFLIDPYQVMEGRAAGAGGVWSSCACSIRAASQRCSIYGMLKMFVLLEAIDAADLGVAHEVLAPRRRS